MSTDSISRSGPLVTACIDLAKACVAARDRSDWRELQALMKARDCLYKELDASEAEAYFAWTRESQ